jgi:hypothetical protein
MYEYEVRSSKEICDLLLGQNPKLTKTLIQIKIAHNEMISNQNQNTVFKS